MPYRVRVMNELIVEFYFLKFRNIGDITQLYAIDIFDKHEV